jgi:hypothetical protein
MLLLLWHFWFHLNVYDGFANVILSSQDIYAIGGVEGGVLFNVLLLLMFLLIEII